MFGWKVGETVERKRPTWVRVGPRKTESHRHRGDITNIYRCTDGPLFEFVCEVCGAVVQSSSGMLKGGIE